MARPGRILVALLALLALGLSGCVAAVASAPQPRTMLSIETPTPEPVELPQLRVAYTETSAAHTALWFTHAADLFRKHGVHVTLARHGEAAAYAGLANGDLDLVAGSGRAALIAALDGAELRFVAGLVNAMPYRLMVVPGVESAADLRAIRLGVGRPESASEVATRAALQALKLEPGTDVGLLEIGAAPERLAAMENGIVQGGLVAPPDTVLLERIGYSTMLDLTTRVQDAPNTQVVAAERLVREEPDQVQRFVNALIEGIALAKREPALAKRVLRYYLYTQDEAAIDATYALFVDRLAQRAPFPAERGLRQEWARLLDTHPRAAEITPTMLIQRRFVQDAVDSGLLGQLYPTP